MLKGGYKIIDLKGTNFTSDVGVIIDGVYEDIESTNKPTLISNFSISNKEYDSVYCFLVKQNTTFHGLINFVDVSDSVVTDKEILIEVEDNNTVTLTEM